MLLNNADCGQVLKLLKPLGWTNYNIIYCFRKCCQEGPTTTIYCFRKCCLEGPTTIQYIVQEMLLEGTYYNTIYSLGNVARRDQLQYNILFQEMLLGGTNYNTIYCLGNVTRRGQLQQYSESFITGTILYKKQLKGFSPPRHLDSFNDPK